MAANRTDTLRTAISKTYQRGGLLGFYQGLIPWAGSFLCTISGADLTRCDLQAWIESGTTGGLLLFTSTYVEDFATTHGVSPGTAGLLGGIAGGAAQAYLAMGKRPPPFSSSSPLFLTCSAIEGICTTMKTAEVTRAKVSRLPSTIPGQPGAVVPIPSTWSVFANMYRQGGISGINKGVNAVALRQMTNWGSRCVGL
jgi:hypothetical protein